MKIWRSLPLLLLALDSRAADLCADLSGDARTQCESNAKNDLPVLPPPPPSVDQLPRYPVQPVLPPTPPRQEMFGGKFRTGQEFDSPRTFTGTEQGTPGY